MTFRALSGTYVGTVFLTFLHSVPRKFRMVKSASSIENFPLSFRIFVDDNCIGIRCWKDLWNLIEIGSLSLHLPDTRSLLANYYKHHEIWEKPWSKLTISLAHLLSNIIQFSLRWGVSRAIKWKASISSISCKTVFSFSSSYKKVEWTHSQIILNG